MQHLWFEDDPGKTSNTLKNQKLDLLSFFFKICLN